MHAATNFRQPGLNDTDIPDDPRNKQITAGVGAIGHKISLMGNKALHLDDRSWISSSNADAYPSLTGNRDDVKRCRKWDIFATFRGNRAGAFHGI